MTGTAEHLSLEDVSIRAGRILDEVERAVVGKRPALELALCALLADGHVLIEDYPGLAKTLIARSFATVTGMRFSRVQFTPDLMPSDVTGASIFNQRTAEFEFRPGPVFTNVLLADEINRAPRRPRPRYWRRCRSDRSPQKTARVRSSGRSWCWRPRTRSSTKVPIPSRRRSSIDS